ncbi:PREDICTED: cytochrome P450 705A20-like [Tarenaya hassleriana]|uniref:cytochrome P450 705A20-like n=1 Tax=Tarenaya hassleriana TaxID=28532 RepID=UPI00053C164E|nr:PREDICTED: cytochrome P450 705A20-like [Tarenaya hassleriana]
MAAIIVDFQHFFFFIFFFFFFLLLFSRSIFALKNPKKSPNCVRNLPPSPRALPFIGHLHLLVSVPWFRSLRNLSSKYGPLLYLRTFDFEIALVSSASIAYKVFREQDLNFSSREALAVENSLLFGSYGVAAAPYGGYCRFMRKLMLSELLGRQALERSRSLRAEEMERFRCNLWEKARRNEAVDLGMETTRLANDSICKMIMGKKCSEEAEQVRDSIAKSYALTKKVYMVSSLHKTLRKLGIWLFGKEIKEISSRYDELFEKILREHEENPDRGQKDMMDVLLETCQDETAEYKITRNHIKAFFVDLFLGGTDTSAQATQWTMAELINHPNILKRLREEIDSVVGTKRGLEETDLSKLPYLQAVIKEGLRLHPPAPILSRKSKEDCKIGEFVVPRDATLIVNVYAVMRDPGSWEDPDVFKPERFLVSEEEEDNDKEKAMKYIPFGGGRRGCPGANLGYVFIGMAIGIMVQCFDWRISGGEKVNTEEAGDINLAMAHPLRCIPVVRFDSLPLTKSVH